MLKHVALAVSLALTPLSVFANDIPIYKRSDWKHWIDVDKDCQNLRHEMLISQSLTEVTFKNEDNCTVETGRWVGPYSGKTYTKASQVDIDHIVPLNEAHRSGGWQWSKTLKQVFANDPENLLVTGAGPNRSKSDQDPAQWFKILPGFQCEYLTKWISIKRRYNLKMDEAEKSFVLSAVSKC